MLIRLNTIKCKLTDTCWRPYTSIYSCFDLRIHNASTVQRRLGMAGNINVSLTEREGRTGEYWPEVVAVRTDRSEVRTKTTEGQYSPVRLEQARLVSSLLYGTRSKLVYFKKRTSGHLNSKGFRRDVFLMTRATQKEQATVPRG